MATKSRSQQRLVRPRAGDGPGKNRLADHLASEEPMAMEVDDARVATTMRTPGNDFKLAGFARNGAMAVYVDA